MRTVATQTTELDVDELRCTWAGVELHVSTEAMDSLVLNALVNGKGVCSCVLDTLGVVVLTQKGYSVTTDVSIEDAPAHCVAVKDGEQSPAERAQAALFQACEALEELHFYREDVPSLELFHAAKELIMKLQQYTGAARIAPEDLPF